MKASKKWKSDLQAWAIPKEIIDQAPENPWIHPPVLFQIPVGLKVKTLSGPIHSASGPDEIVTI